MLLWYARSTAGTFSESNKMKTPSTYKIDWEDLDNKTYRSIATGDMIDTVISKKWSKLQFSYKHLTEAEVNTILTAINVNPIYVKAINPLFPSGYIEAQFRCSKASCEMLEDHCYTLSFNLVQKKKVSGQ
jgi:hypothetical protein